MASAIVFQIKLGNTTFTEKMSFDDDTTASAIQKIYDHWKEQQLVCRWWSEMPETPESVKQARRNE